MPIQLMISSIFETASKNPNKSALIYGENSLSYETLATKVRAAATFLSEQGVQRSDRVLLAAQNMSPTFVYGYFACHLLGAICVPIDAKIGSNTLREIAKQTRPRLSCLSSAPDFDLAHTPVDSLDCDLPLAMERVNANPDDTADILFTAGTTGKPKGIMQSHRNINAFAVGRESIIGGAIEHKLLLPLALSHGFGLGRLRSTMRAGGTIILIDGLVAPEHLFRALEEHNPSGFCCVPSGFTTLFQLTGDKLGDYRHQLRYIETATAPLPGPLKERLVELFPSTKIFNTYGLTEATSTVAFVDLHAIKGQNIPVGRPVAGVEIKIVNEECGEVARGATGQIVVGGDNVMKGYWEDPKRTRRVITGKWLFTNDVGFFDADGYLNLVGRKEELINVGGLKVAPAEVEAALQEHSAISECACVGIDDPRGTAGETIAVYLVPQNNLHLRPSDDDLTAFLRRLIESHKIPSRFVWIDELPKNAIGKLQRLRLREFDGVDLSANRICMGNLTLIDLVRQIFSLGSATLVTDEDGPGTLDGWDSLGNVKLILAIQDTYGVSIEPSDVIEMDSIAGIRSILRSKGVLSV
jgi:long-chain acyl-CoA synthetase